MACQFHTNLASSWKKKKKIYIYIYVYTHTHISSEDPLDKEMTTHSSILAWEIPWTEEPGGLQSMGSQRVRHD